MSRLGRGMRRGLNGAGDGLFIDKNKQTKQNYPVGENRTAGRLGKAGQDRTGHDRIHAMTITSMTNWHGTANTRRL